MPVLSIVLSLPHTEPLTPCKLSFCHRFRSLLQIALTMVNPPPQAPNAGLGNEVIIIDDEDDTPSFDRSSRNNPDGHVANEMTQPGSPIQCEDQSHV